MGVSGGFFFGVEEYDRMYLHLYIMVWMRT